jgi:hypothetical protein
MNKAGPPKKNSILELAKLMDAAVRVKCLGGRELKGTLRGYNKHKILMQSLLPASRWMIEALNAQIRQNFHKGHRLAKPAIAHVLGYDKEHKAQWLASID